MCCPYRPFENANIDSRLGDNDRMILVLFAKDSEFDRKVQNTPPGQIVDLKGMEQEEDTDREDSPPPRQRIKIEPDSTAGSTTQAGLEGVGASSSIQQSLSANIGSGWLLDYHAVKSITPVPDAAKQLVAFYNNVVDKAAAQLKAGAAEAKRLAFKLGDISLSLTGTDVIYWDWVIDFAMSMVDSTNLANPIQYASTVSSKWQQSTIQVELFLDGVGAS
ncbi:MAG: hypothetical protein Q9201_003092 [Fulgogasparrea decipioides]